VALGVLYGVSKAVLHLANSSNKNDEVAQHLVCKHCSGPGKTQVLQAYSLKNAKPFKTLQGLAGHRGNWGQRRIIFSAG